MNIHQCGTYNQSYYCSCLSETNSRQDHYKQYNHKRQTHNCCNKINISPGGMSPPPLANPTGDTQNYQAAQYLDYINEHFEKHSSCDYKKYWNNGPSTSIESENYLSKNFPELYQNTITHKAMYQAFIYNKNIPVLSDYRVSCPVLTEVPYIVSFKSNYEKSVYDSNMFVCIDKKNAFNTITVGNNVKYNIQNFIDNTGNKCTSSDCALNYENPANHNNNGNKQPIYKNSEKKVNIGYLVGGIICTIIVIILSFFLWRINKRIKEKSLV